MKNYYQLSAEETMKELNGSTAQGEVRTERAGGGEEKDSSSDFPGTVQGFSCHHPYYRGDRVRFYGRCGERGGHPDRDHDECDPRYSPDREGRAVAGKPEEAFRSGGKGAERRKCCTDPVI